MTTICVNNPYWYSLKAELHYLGARKRFLDQYVDYIYFSPLQFLKWMSHTDFETLKHVISSKKIIFSVDQINRFSDVFITLNEKFSSPENFVTGVNVFKINALYDYNIDTEEIIKKIQIFKIDALIGQGRHDLNCKYFRNYINPLGLQLIHFPFGWRMSNNNKKLKDKSIPFSALGAIAPIKGRSKIENPELELYLDFFSDRDFSHLDRRWIFKNKENLPSSYVIELPDSLTMNRLVDVDEQAILQKSKSTYIDCGSLNFLPARFFEALGNDVIPITNISLQISELGFNSIDSFVLKNLNDSSLNCMIDLINENYESTLIRYNKYKEKFTFDSVSKNLFDNIENLIL